MSAPSSARRRPTRGGPRGQEDRVARIDLGLARRDPFDATRRAELVDELLAVERDRALPGELPRPDDGEVGGLHGHVERGEDVVRQLAKLGCCGLGLMDSTVPFDDGRAATRAIHALAATDRNGDKRIGGRHQRRNGRYGLTRRHDRQHDESGQNGSNGLRHGRGTNRTPIEFRPRGAPRVHHTHVSAIDAAAQGGPALSTAGRCMGCT
jgi:hypothetical protein